VPTTNIEKYAAIMKEIKLRTEVITLFMSGQRDAHYAPTNVETIGLQFRKVFELIAFASLVANRKQYSAVHADFSTHWEASKLLKRLEKINPKFYPKPVVEMPSTRHGEPDEFKERDPDYLTQSELIEAHGRCGELMHAAKPFGNPIDYEWYERNFPIWMSKVINLLNAHQVHIIDDTGFWLIHMLEKGKGNEVAWHRFEELKSNI
jgi:hypothetical protein